MTWAVRRPAFPLNCRDLDLDEAARAIIGESGSIIVAARKLGVPATDLRTAVRASPALEAAVSEGLDRLIDEAQQVMLDGLKHPDRVVRLRAASALMRTCPYAWRRGWGRGVLEESR